MLFGIIVCLTAVFLLGLDGRFVSPGAYPAICQTRAWLLSAGFTLSFGAMFSKVWRVHRLTTKAKSDPKVRMVSAKLITRSILREFLRFLQFYSQDFFKFLYLRLKKYILLGD